MHLNQITKNKPGKYSDPIPLKFSEAAVPGFLF